MNGADLLSIFVLMAVVLVIIVIGARVQSQSYRRYLEKIAAENEKLVESQRRTEAAVDCQTLALERIAVAIEKTPAH